MQQRLQKLISAAGIASRRHAEELITAGQVNVNGKVVTELGAKADPDTDHIKVKGRLINALVQKRENIYVLLNKPRGYLTSMADPEGRPLVTELKATNIGTLDDKFLATGQWRALNDIEVRRLKNAGAKKPAPPTKNARVKRTRSPNQPKRARRS